jgi:IPT/TIG domain
MAFAPAPSRHSDLSLSSSPLAERVSFPRCRRARFTIWTFFAVAVAIALAMPLPLLYAQSSPQITAVAPTTGKVNSSITITGKNLGKDQVVAVFLSDAKLDHKAAVVDQEDTKIVIKVPEVKPGAYNISLQEGKAIYIQPVLFNVQG